MESLTTQFRIRTLIGALLIMGVDLSLTGCGFSLAPLPPGSIAGRSQLYDYSPAVIQSGDFQQSWWCGLAYNPKDRTQFSDTIQYQSLNLTSHVRYGPVTVLSETPGAWDSVYTCNPKVIQGTFDNPLGDAENFSYAMYYVATNNLAGTNNSIGVAFSKDGIRWKKYPQPVILPERSDGYGVGQPALYNSDRHSAIRIFYEDDALSIHHLEAISTDGVHFTSTRVLTTAGLDPTSPTWADMAYDERTGDWYSAFNTAPRDPSTTGQVIERGSYGIELYRIPDASLVSGATPWQLLANIDTNLNGYESNFLPAFVRDPYGNLISSQKIQMYTSVSNPPPPWNASPAAAGASGDVANWNISSAAWTPDPALTALTRYFNQTTHEVTTGWVDPEGNFSPQSTLGHLYRSPQAGATVPFYGCKGGTVDFFISLDHACEGSRILGVNGYAYARPVAGLNLVALYRCSTGHDHFVSADMRCEGETNQELLGYVLP